MDAQSATPRSSRVRATPALKRATKLWAILPRSPSVRFAICSHPSGKETAALELQSLMTCSKMAMAPVMSSS